jgi:hypothetical protein
MHVVTEVPDGPDDPDEEKKPERVHSGKIDTLGT